MIPQVYFTEAFHILQILDMHMPDFLGGMGGVRLS